MSKHRPAPTDATAASFDPLLDHVTEHSSATDILRAKIAVRAQLAALPPAPDAPTGEN